MGLRRADAHYGVWPFDSVMAIMVRIHTPSFIFDRRIIMKKYNCPCCERELIRLEPFEDGIYDFWCDKCNIDIQIIKNKEIEKENEHAN